MGKSSVYTFKVDKPGDIDWARICRECAEDGHDAVVVTVRGAEKATVMLAEEFRDFGGGFTDAIVAGGHLASNAWSTKNGGGAAPVLTDYRWWIRRDIDAADIGKTIQEIRAIKARTSPLKVNVHCVEARETLEPRVKTVDLGTLKPGDFFKCLNDVTVRMVRFRDTEGVDACESDAKLVRFSAGTRVIPVRATFENVTE